MRKMDVEAFAERRLKLGQEKYGVGEANAGWRRDNGRDVMEEIHDAIVISGFWLERLRRREDHEMALKIQQLIIDLNALLLRVADLREQTPEAIRQDLIPTKRFPPQEEVELSDATA